MDREIKEVTERLLKSAPLSNDEQLRKDVISDMDALGKFNKTRIEENLENKVDEYIEIEEALKDRSSIIYYIGILAQSLKNKGITTVIKKKEEHQEIANANLQMLFSGLSTLKKIDICFDKEVEQSAKCNTKELLTQFQDLLKTKLNTICGIQESRIIIGNPSAMHLPIVIQDVDSIEKIGEFEQELKSENEEITEVKLVSLLEGIELSPEMFDERGNNDDRGWAPEGEERGPPENTKPYYPPRGWKGIGLNVYNKYDNDNNDWLDYRNVPGEWWIAYHGLIESEVSSEGVMAKNYIPGSNVNYQGDDDLNHPGEKIKEGVYCSCEPKVVLNDSQFGKGTNGYYIAFMCRVNPKSVQICKSNPSYWVVPGDSNSIRPYRLLLKEIH